MTPPLHVELLTRQGCGLCDKARRALDAVAGELPLDVVSVDIDDDAALLRAFDWRVPVVRHQGAVLCEGVVTEEALR
jgi:glutaredoxin